jgi:hypothetical protein
MIDQGPPRPKLVGLVPGLDLGLSHYKQCCREPTATNLDQPFPLYFVKSQPAASSNLLYMSKSSSLQTKKGWLRRTRSFAHNLVVDGDFIRLFNMLRWQNDSEDALVREPFIVELRDYIQGSDETARRSVVDAGILPLILPTHGKQTKDDLVSFMTTCLPILGPSFTQCNGGSTLFPLLTNEDSRIRSAATQALKNAVDSHHGNVENMAKAGIVETLHPLTATDEAIRDLWCRILPKVAPFLTNEREVDILFENLKYVILLVVRRN